MKAIQLIGHGGLEKLILNNNLPVPEPAYLNELRLIGSTGFSHGEFKKIVSYIETKKIKPVVAKTYPLDNIHQAQKDFIDKKFFGKLVLVP